MEMQEWRERMRTHREEIRAGFRDLRITIILCGIGQVLAVWLLLPVVTRIATTHAIASSTERWAPVFRQLKENQALLDSIKKQMDESK